MTGNSWGGMSQRKTANYWPHAVKDCSNIHHLINISPPDISIGSAEIETYIDARSNIKLFRGEGLLPRRRFGAAVIDRHRKRNRNLAWTVRAAQGRL